MAILQFLGPTNEDTLATMAALYPLAFAQAAALDSPSGRAMRLWQHEESNFTGSFFIPSPVKAPGSAPEQSGNQKENPASLLFPTSMM